MDQDNSVAVATGKVAIILPDTIDDERQGDIADPTNRLLASHGSSSFKVQ